MSPTITNPRTELQIAGAFEVIEVGDDERGHFVRLRQKDCADSYLYVSSRSDVQMLGALLYRGVRVEIKEIVK